MQVNLSYNGQDISQRQDGYVNATQMAKANDYRLDKLIETASYQNYLEALKNSIPPENRVNDRLTDVKGFGAEKAMWVHPLVALMIAQNISPEFHVWCNSHIKTLMETGTTTIVEETQPALPTALEIGKMFVAAETERLRLASELEAAQPAIEFHQAIKASPGCISMGAMAKMLGIGRTTFFGKMRQMKVIQQNDTLPYQQYLNSGYFEVTENSMGFPCAVVTGIGQTWLQKKVAKWEQQQVKKDAVANALDVVFDAANSPYGF